MKILTMILLAVPLVTACTSGPSKRELDAEVDRLCAIDGGIRVYETVTLPADKFNKWGEINFYRPTQGENTLGSEYIYQWDTHYYKKGDPVSQGVQETAMRRDHIKVIKRIDMKLLGEFVKYHRAGGDLPGPWMPSSYHCPDKSKANESLLLKSVFIKSTERSVK